MSTCNYLHIDYGERILEIGIALGELKAQMDVVGNDDAEIVSLITEQLCLWMEYNALTSPPVFYTETNSKDGNYVVLNPSLTITWDGGIQNQCA